MIERLSARPAETREAERLPAVDPLRAQLPAGLPYAVSPPAPSPTIPPPNARPSLSLASLLGELVPPALSTGSARQFFERSTPEGRSWWRWQAPAAFNTEPYQRKAFDFQQRCLNMCDIGGWGSCIFENGIKQDDCNGISGRSLVSSAARRMPLVREVLRLMGSSTTKLPTDHDQGISLSARVVQGGLGLGVEAKW